MRAIFTKSVLDYVESDKYQEFLNAQKRLENMLKKAAVRYMREVNGYDLQYLIRQDPARYYTVDVPLDLDKKVVVNYYYVDTPMRGGTTLIGEWKIDPRELMERYAPKNR